MAIYSDVKIVNIALGRIGAKRIAALSEESKEAREANAIYELMRDEVTARHPWPFAVKRVELAQSADAPSYGFDYAYVLPSDNLRVLEVQDQDLAGEMLKKYVIENGLLLTDDDEVLIKYISRVTDPAKFSPQFVSTFAYRLSAELAMSVAKDTKLMLEMRQLYDRTFHGDTAEVANQDHNDDTIYFNERYYNSRSIG